MDEIRNNLNQQLDGTQASQYNNNSPKIGNKFDKIQTNQHTSPTQQQNTFHSANINGQISLNLISKGTPKIKQSGASPIVSLIPTQNQTQSQQQQMHLKPNSRGASLSASHNEQIQPQVSLNQPFKHIQLTNLQFSGQYPVIDPSLDAQHKKIIAKNMTQNQQKTLNNSVDRFPVKPLSSQGNVGAMNLSIQMLSARRQQSLELVAQRTTTNNNSTDDSAEPQIIHMTLKQKLQGSGAPGATRKRARDKSYDLYNQKIQLPPMLKPSLLVGSPGQSIQSQDNQAGAGQNQNGAQNRAPQSVKSVDGRIFKIPSRGDSGQLNAAADNAVNANLAGIVSPRVFAGQQPSQSSGRFTQNLLSQPLAAQAKIVNKSPVNGFFTTRFQQINSSGTQGAQLEQQPTTQSPDSVYSPRRQIIPQQQVFASSAQTVLQTIPKNGRLHSQQRNQNGQSLSETATLMSNGKPLSPTSELQSSSRSPGLQLEENPVTPANRVRTRPQNLQPVNYPVTSNGPHQDSSDSSSVHSVTTAATNQANSNQKNTTSPRSNEPPGIETEQIDPNIQFVDVQTLLFGDAPFLNPKTIFLRNHEPTKASQKKCGYIKSYAANTNQGIIREYNEDRVSIILNILKPRNKQIPANMEWPQICFFGVFDGHGGANCADYLRDNLHNFVIQNEKFPQHPEEAIAAGFKECERSFLQLVELAQARTQKQNPGQVVGPERSGSCAMCVIIINDMAYVVNVGDSRCLMSINSGSQTAVLSRDHKPDCELERKRIQAAGGKVYRTQTFAKAASSPDEKDLYVQGPLRVFPGRLSVSRTFGDIEAKRPRYGGNANVIVCEPEIRTFKLKDNFDFFLIGCDGIFERLSNKQIIDCVWDRISEQTTTRQPDQISPPSRFNQFQRDGTNRTFHYDEHIAAAEGVEMGLRETAVSRSLDNITILILGLKGLKTTIKKLNQGVTLQQIRQQRHQEQMNVQNTYAEDFFEVEINETDLFNLNDERSVSANPGLDDDIFQINNGQISKEKQAEAGKRDARSGKQTLVGEKTTKKV